MISDTFLWPINSIDQQNIHKKNLSVLLIFLIKAIKYVYHYPMLSYEGMSKIKQKSAQPRRVTIKSSRHHPIVLV